MAARFLRRWLPPSWLSAQPYAPELTISGCILRSDFFAAGRKFELPLLIAGLIKHASSYQFLCTVPTWVTEITPPSHRGSLGNIIAVNIGLGYVICSFAGIGFYFVSGSSQWRGTTGLQMLFPGLLLAGIYWIPESPRYLIAKDRHEEALKILKSLHAGAGKEADHYAEREYYQIQQQIKFDNAHKMSYLQIFRHPTMRKRALITICLTWCMEGSGVLVINSKFSLHFLRSDS